MCICALTALSPRVRFTNQYHPLEITEVAIHRAIERVVCLGDGCVLPNPTDFVVFVGRPGRVLLFDVATKFFVGRVFVNVLRWIGMDISAHNFNDATPPVHPDSRARLGFYPWVFATELGKCDEGVRAHFSELK
jgi:hypothetical protein